MGTNIVRVMLTCARFHASQSVLHASEFFVVHFLNRSNYARVEVKIVSSENKAHVLPVIFPFLRSNALYVQRNFLCLPSNISQCLFLIFSNIIPPTNFLCEH